MGIYFMLYSSKCLWVKCFTDKSRINCFSFYFHHCKRGITIIVCINSLIFWEICSDPVLCLLSTHPLLGGLVSSSGYSPGLESYRRLHASLPLNPTLHWAYLPRRNAFVLYNFLKEIHFPFNENPVSFTWPRNAVEVPTQVPFPLDSGVWIRPNLLAPPLCRSLLDG